MAAQTADSFKPSDEPRVTRLSILAAARRVLVRDGAAVMNLAEVAAEANFAPEILNGHFENAQELLLALAADDLASMAQAMRPNAAAEEPGAADSERSQSSRPGGTLKRRSQMSGPLEQVMKEVAPETNTGSGTPIARIERRIQMLEKAFVEVGERQEKVSRERNDALAAVDQTILALRKRLEESGEQQAELVAGLKKALMDINVRVNGLEVTTHTVGAPAVEMDSAQPGLDFAEPMLLDQEEPEPPRSTDAPESQTYLSAARRAANEAVAEATEDLSARPQPKRKRRAQGRRTRFILIGCLAPMVIIATAIAVLNRHSVTAETVHMTMPATLSQPPEIVLTTPRDPMPSEIPSSVPFEQVLGSAQTGDAKAERDVGLRYLAGNGVGANQMLAARWLLRSAYQGEAVAEYWLGTLYARGAGVPADEAQANHWYEAAARKGNRRAMHSLGVAYLEGIGKDKNEAEAARWFEQAAMLGLVDAAFNLAVLYERGLGVKQNLADAFKWYGIAAARGDKPARIRMGALAQRLHPADLALAQQAAETFKPKPINASANLGG